MPVVDDNVTLFPDRIVRRAVKAINQYASALVDEDRGRRAAIYAVIEYGSALLEGRKEYTGNVAFSKWVADNGLDQGKPWDDSRERSAAMQIAKIVNGSGAVNGFTDCPNATPTHIMRWYRKQHPETVRAKKPSTKAKQREKALDAIKTLQATGMAITVEAISQRAGVSNGTAGEAYAIHVKAKEAAAKATAKTTEALTEDQLLAHAEATLSIKGKMTIQKTLTILKKRQETIFWTAVGEEVRRQIAKADDAVRKGYNELRPAHMRLEARYAELRRQKGVFTQKEFRQLQMCVHPDNTASIDVRNRILDLLVKNEKRLVIPD